MKTKTTTLFRACFTTRGADSKYRYCLEATQHTCGDTMYSVMDAEQTNAVGLCRVIAQWTAATRCRPVWIPLAVWARCVDAVEEYRAQAAIDACCAAVEARGYTVPPGHCGVDFESGKAYACSGETTGPATYHDSALTVQSRREPDGTWSAPY